MPVRVGSDNLLSTKAIKLKPTESFIKSAGHTEVQNANLSASNGLQSILELIKVNGTLNLHTIEVLQEIKERFK